MPIIEVSILPGETLLVDVTGPTRAIVDVTAPLPGAVGPAGPPGDPGPAGADGADGSDGTDGADGTDGVDGIDGAPGATGAAGATGATGTTGATGATGATGPAGADGEDGEGESYAGLTQPASDLLKIGNEVALQLHQTTDHYMRMFFHPAGWFRMALTGGNNPILMETQYGLWVTSDIGQPGLVLMDPSYNPVLRICASTPSVTRPAATSDVRGLIWLTRHNSGTIDELAICVRKADDSYEWVSLTAPVGGGGGGGGGLVLLATRTAAASAALDFTSLITSDYDVYQFEFVCLSPTTTNTELRMLVSTDNGATWEITNYQWVMTYANQASTALTTFSAATAAYWLACGGINNSAAGGVSGTVKLYDPLQATRNKHAESSLLYLHNDGNRYVFQGRLWYNGAAVNAVRFILDSGTIASGSIRLYGYAK